MISRVLTGAVVATTSSVAMAIGLAAPAQAAGNNVVNAHCDDIVLDLKDNPLEADSRGVVTVDVNGRIVFTGPIDRADFHEVLTGFPRHDSGYEWKVVIANPYTGAELFRTAGDVHCQPSTPTKPAQPSEPITTDVPLPTQGAATVPDEFPTQAVTDVPLPTQGAATVPDEFPTQAVTDVPLPTFEPQTPDEFPTQAVTDVPLPTFEPQTPDEFPTQAVTDVPLPVFEPQAPLDPTVVTVRVPATGGRIDVVTTTQPTEQTSTSTMEQTTPAARTTSLQTAGETPSDQVLGNLGGPDTGWALAGGGLLAGGLALILAARRRRAS